MPALRQCAFRVKIKKIMHYLDHLITAYLFGRLCLSYIIIEFQLCMSIFKGFITKNQTQANFI